MTKLLAKNEMVTVSASYKGTTMELIKPVTIYRHSDSYSSGYIGGIEYRWNSKKYLYPSIRVNGKWQVGTTNCLTAKQFLIAWKEALLERRKTVVCYKAHDINSAKSKARSVAQDKENYISGHPLWLRKEKLPIECHVTATGETYMSHRIVPEQMRALVESYVKPYCYKCMFRAGCEKPCDNPAQSCKDV